jgi:hypothetical protein
MRSPRVVLNAKTPNTDIKPVEFWYK